MMPCNGKSVNLNISNSAFCRNCAQSKNIREQVLMTEDCTISPSISVTKHFVIFMLRVKI